MDEHLLNAPTQHPTMTDSDGRGRSLSRRGSQSETSFPSAYADASTPSAMMPPAGLYHLKTRAENRAQTDTIHVWTIELPSKAANHALKYVSSSLFMLRTQLTLPGQLSSREHRGSGCC